ncbi:MAG: serine/threonine protein kinase [Limisphaerales bacterium]
MTRRNFLLASAFGTGAVAVTGAAGCSHPRSTSSGRSGRKRSRLFFTSAGKTCLIHADGTGFRALEFDVPNQATWQPGGFFADGRRVLFLSMEPRRDGPGRPFDEYYTQTPTHLWVHDLDSGALDEVATRDRLAVFYTPQLLLNDDRLLVQVVRNKIGQVFNMRLDGSDAVPFTQAGEGLPYGFSLSPDGQQVAFHLAGPRGYGIWVAAPDGTRRTLVAEHPERLYFGPSWSPDGQWLAFQDCRYRQDPGHDWSDLWVARPDGSEARQLTEGQALWFGATYGNPTRRGGGSNVPSWTSDGGVLVSRRLPGSQVAWEYQTQRPDTDHFNRDWKPENAKGGTELCRIDPRDGSSQSLTRSEPPVWDFRGVESSDGRWIAFCRAGTGEVPALWIRDSRTGAERLLHRGINEEGADHPRWLPNLG